MNVGEVLTFNYTGGMQSVTLDKGLYKLECWGGQGRSNRGGKGGYSVGYIIVTDSLTLYICVGQGYDGTNQLNGGYNGGGNGNRFEWNESWYYGYGGGGATHIAKVNGVLKDIGYTSFVTNHNGLIVAGGGGGSTRDQKDGGAGGGLTGGNGENAIGVATQTSGYAFGQGQNSDRWDDGGGGGGLYGGYGGGSSNGSNYSCGGGGSGWIDGVPVITFKGGTYSPTTINGSRSGNGLAKITLVANTFPSVIFNGVTMDAAIIDGVSIDSFILDGEPI